MGNTHTPLLKTILHRQARAWGAVSRHPVYAPVARPSTAAAAPYPSPTSHPAPHAGLLPVWPPASKIHASTHPLAYHAVSEGDRYLRVRGSSEGGLGEMVV